MTVREMVAALVEARHTVGSQHRLRARTRLAVDLGVSEQSVRNWLNGTDPIPAHVENIHRLYSKEKPNG